MRRLTFAAFGLAAVLFAADQATKEWVLWALPRHGAPIEVTSFFDITLVWNRGISYGLFQQEGFGRWLLVAISIVASIALAVWIVRTRQRLVALGAALILSGALGNLVDRVRYGAVVDFVHLHAGDWSWYVFNVADAAIVVGVIVLVVDSFWPARTAADAPGAKL